MTERTEELVGEPLPAAKFIEGLESEFGVRLYFGLAPEYNTDLQDISSKSSSAIKDLIDCASVSAGHAIDFQPTGNVVKDFKKLLKEGLPHQEAVEEPLHFIADEFCRATLRERLEIFLQNCVDCRKDGFVILDELPYKLEFSEFLFETRSKFYSFEEYIREAKERPERYANLFPELNDDQRKKFKAILIAGLDELSMIAKLHFTNRASEVVEPIHNVAASAPILRFYIKRQEEVVGDMDNINDEIPFLPIESEIIDHVLRESQGNAMESFEEENKLLDGSNPGLQDLIRLYELRQPKIAGDIVEGLLWTFKVLRLQASGRGFTLPEVTENTLHKYLDDYTTLIRYLSRGGNEVSGNEINEFLLEKILAKEPGLKRMLDEVMKYRMYKIGFYLGVVDAYMLYRKAYLEG